MASAAAPARLALAMVAVLGCGKSKLHGSGGLGLGGTGGHASGATGGGDNGDAGGASGDGLATDGGGDGAGRPLPASCQDGVRNGNETDLDCGGDCGPCGPTAGCARASDCQSGICAGQLCALASGPPSWLPGPSLNQGRGYATAGLALMNGQSTLLAFSGRDDGTTADPAPSSYEELSSISQPQTWTVHTDAVGTMGAPVTDAAGDLLIFSPQSVWQLSVPNAWTMLPTATPTARTAAAATLGGNGLVYLLGGSTSADVGTVEAYDPAANTWTTGLRAMPTSRHDLAAATGADGLVYALGGRTSAGDVATVEAYDPATNNWASKSPLPAPASGLTAAAAPDGRIYVLGAAGGAVVAYNPGTDRWAPVASLSDQRVGVGVAVTPDGHLWALGGTTDPGQPGETTVEVYGPNITCSPGGGAAGTMLMVAGTNFAPNTRVSVYFDSLTGPVRGIGMTNSAGTLAAPIVVTVPALPAGTVKVIAIDDRSHYPISTSFRVE